MVSRNIKIFFVFALTCFILFNLNENRIDIRASRPILSGVNNISETNKEDVYQEENNPKELPHYKIDGMDRFEWYTKKWKEALKDEKPPKVEQVSLFRAYEYDVEYAVVTTPPKVFKAILYCRYFDKDGKEILPAFQSYSFPEYVVNCEKRRGTKRISISTEANNNYTYPIPLVDRTKKGYKHEFSFCMAPIYGKESKWMMIPEVIEHYKLQGMTHFYFYVFHINEYDNAILEDYIRTGEVEVTYMLGRNDKEVSNWKHMAYKDCTLRGRHESKWSLYADMDERLLMTKYPGNILDYLRTVSDPEIGGIQFRQQWIMKTEFMPEKYEGDKQIDTWAPTLRWHNSSSFGPPGHTVKCIVQNEKVLAMWTHYPTMMFPGYSIHQLKPEEGIVRHYRDQQMWNWGKVWLKDVLKFGPMSLTDYPAKYQKDLIDAVKKRTKYVYEHYYVEPE